MIHDEEITLAELKTLEEFYSSKYWSDMPEFEELTHLILHNQKMLGLLGNVCEVGQHAAKGDMKLPILTEHLKRRLVANYLIWATHYAKVWGLNMAECFVAKHLDNIKRASNEAIYGKSGRCAI